MAIADAIVKATSDLARTTRGLFLSSKCLFKDTPDDLAHLRAIIINYIITECHGL